MKPLPSLLLALVAFLGFRAGAQNVSAPQLPAAGEASRPPNARPGTPPQGGPYAHKVLSASSTDGLHWTRDAGVRLEHASVPCAVAANGKVFLYFVDANRGPDKSESVGCAISEDGLNFTRQPFGIEGMPGNKAVDPSVLCDADGKFRLYYFVSSFGGGDPASERGEHTIRLAFSDDGIRFKDAGLAFSREGLVDPDVFFYKGTWFMYVFGRGNTLIATSQDGRHFSYKQELSPRDHGTVAPVLLDDGRLRLYAFEQRKSTANAFRSFLSTDGINWTPEEGVRLQAGSNEQITDPFVVRWQGGWKMFFKTEVRSAAQFTGGPQSPPAGGEREGSGAPNARSQNRPSGGPWDRDVIAYRVNADGNVEKTATFGRAGVPTITRLKDGQLIAAHQHFPENNEADFDKVAARFSSDDGKSWSEPKVIQVEGLPEGMRFPFDPTLVALPDGRVRLYFTGNYGRSFERSIPAIHSAISGDGVHYTYEPGVRLSVEGRPVIDCAAVLHQGVFHLYAPDNGTQLDRGQRPGQEPPQDRPRSGIGYHATSKDGLNFTRAEDVTIDGRRRWLGNAQSDGIVITFYGTGDGGGPPTPGEQQRGGLWVATSADGQTWKLALAPAIMGGDPGAVATRDGGLIVVITGEPRPGTASASQRRPGNRPPAASPPQPN